MLGIKNFEEYYITETERLFTIPIILLRCNNIILNLCNGFKKAERRSKIS